MTPDEILTRLARALDQRRPWEGVWQECYDHVLATTPGAGGAALYDGTAPDAAEQLAASLMAELTPPWSRWFGLAPSQSLERAPEAAAARAALDETAETLQGHLDRSNYTQESHQAFLDLVVAGTGVLCVEEAPPGELSAIRFRAIPLREAVLEEGPSGRLDTLFRAVRLSTAEIRHRWPRAELPPRLLAGEPGASPAKHRIVEAVWPEGGLHRQAIVLDQGDGAPIIIAEGRFAEAPFVAFRWMKAPGEVYGRGPVMKALPDIRTANKVVELILKNASIAATGIWQAEDDGVLNPATIRLVPGAIIPKAPGSSGLTPLAAPGKFDVSQLVLEDLRRNIRGALLADRISLANGSSMTATEVLERSAQTARLLGATYGRLQAELLTPLIARALGILRRRGEVPPISLDGREVRLTYQSPLARIQGRADAANTLLFLQSVSGMGAEAAKQVDIPAATRALARMLAAPAEMLVPPNTTEGPSDAPEKE